MGRRARARRSAGGRPGWSGLGSSMIVFPVMSTFVIGFGGGGQAHGASRHGRSQHCGKDALAAGAAAKAARGPNDSRAPGARTAHGTRKAKPFYSNARIGRRAESLNSGYEPSRPSRARLHSATAKRVTRFPRTSRCGEPRLKQRSPGFARSSLSPKRSSSAGGPCVPGRYFRFRPDPKIACSAISGCPAWMMSTPSTCRHDLPPVRVRSSSHEPRRADPQGLLPADQAEAIGQRLRRRRWTAPCRRCQYGGCSGSARWKRPMKFDRITFDPQIMGGRACIRGMRIPVSVIVADRAWRDHRRGAGRLPGPGT